MIVFFLKNDFFKKYYKMFVLYENNKVEITPFLKQGKLIANISEDENDPSEKSDDNLFVVKYYAKDDIVENIDDFINLLNVCNYWMIDYNFYYLESFIVLNLTEIIANIFERMYNIPSDILDICLKYCEVQDFPIFYNLSYHMIDNYKLINYMTENPSVIEFGIIANYNASLIDKSLLIKKKDIILSQNIKLYIDLLYYFEYMNTHGEDNLDLTEFFKKYPKLDQGYGVTELGNNYIIILYYLSTLIKNLDMNYKIIIEGGIYTLFEYFISILLESKIYLYEDYNEEKSEIDILITDKYIGDIDDIEIFPEPNNFNIIQDFNNSISTSNLFYILKDKSEIDYIKNISLLINFDNVYDELEDVSYASKPLAYFLHFLIKDNQELINFLNKKYDWDNIEAIDWESLPDEEYNEKNFMSDFKYNVINI